MTEIFHKNTLLDNKTVHTTKTKITMNQENISQAEGSPNVCELVECDDNYCQNNGVCSVRVLDLECDCPTGTSGDKCQEFTS